MLRVLVSGALYNILNIVVQVLLGLIVFREMLLYFGEADFGTWSLLFAILAHIQLCEFGLGSMISKLVPILRTEDNAKNEAYFSTVFLTMFGISVIFFVILCIVSILVHYSTYTFESEAPFGLVVFLIGFNFLCLFQTGAFHAYLTGNFKIGRLNAVRLFINILRGVLIIVLLQLDYAILTIAYVFAGTALLELILLFVLSLKVGLANDVNISLFSASSFQYVVSRGAKLVFLSINGYTRQNASIIICGFVLGVVAIVPLRIAGRLMEIYMQVSTALNYLLTPYFSSIALGDKNAFNRNFLISISCATSLSAIIFLNIAFAGDWFLNLWLGDVPAYTASILQVMAVGFCIANMQSPCTSVLISKDKNKSIMAMCIIEIITLLIIIYPLILYFGIVGAAYSLTISLIVSRVLVQPLLICSALELRIVTYLLNILIPSFVIFIVVGLLYLFSTNLNMPNENFTIFVFFTIQATIISAFAIYFYRKKKS